MNRSLLRFRVLAALIGLSAAFSAVASEKDKNHPDHLWTQDRNAYRSYDASGPARSFHRVPRSLRPLRLNEEYLLDTLKSLTGVKDPVLGNRGSKAGRLAAREFMRKEFESFGFKVTEQAYRTGVNLIAEKAGRSGKFLVVSAHYDSVGNAGADDDGTGVIAMLNTARMLRTENLKHGLRFVAFDEEELGLVGSKAYVKDLVSKGEKGIILGDLQMEMLGYNARKDGKFHVISCDRKDSEFLVGAMVQAVRNLGDQVKITSACTDRSDHDSFWTAGLPAIVISENFFGGDSNPCYHRSCDKIEGMHFDYFSKLAEVAANAIRLIVVD